MKKKEAIALIEDLTGLEVRNGNARMVYNGQFGLFENEMDTMEDFYFIPVIKMKPIVLYHDREEVWKLSAEKILAAKNDGNHAIVHKENYKKYLFSLQDAEMVYPMKAVSSKPSVAEEAKLTPRDKVCVQLKVPEADSDWVNVLINRHWDMQREHSDYVNAHLHR